MRSKSISYAQEQLPKKLQGLVVFISAMLLLGLVFMGVNDVWIHGLMVVSITVLISLVHFVLSELNHPFNGVWNINKKPFRNFQKKLEEVVSR